MIVCFTVQIDDSCVSCRRWYQQEVLACGQGLYPSVSTQMSQVSAWMTELEVDALIDVGSFTLERLSQAWLAPAADQRNPLCRSSVLCLPS